MSNDWGAMGIKHPILAALNIELGKCGFAAIPNAMETPGTLVGEWVKPAFADVDICVTLLQQHISKTKISFGADIAMRSRLLMEAHNAIKIWECGHPIVYLLHEPETLPSTIFSVSLHWLVLNGTPPKTRIAWGCSPGGERLLALEFMGEFQQYASPILDQIVDYESLISFIRDIDNFPMRTPAGGFSIGDESWLLAFFLHAIGDMSSALAELETGHRIEMAKIERDFQGKEYAQKRARLAEIAKCKLVRHRKFINGQIEILNSN